MRVAAIDARTVRIPTRPECRPSRESIDMHIDMTIRHVDADG